MMILSQALDAAARCWWRAPGKLGLTRRSTWESMQGQDRLFCYFYTCSVQTYTRILNLLPWQTLYRLQWVASLQERGERNTLHLFLHQVNTRGVPGNKLKKSSIEQLNNDEPVLNIYPFFSARDNLSLWVIGPSIGQFIAGIRQAVQIFT